MGWLPEAFGAERDPERVTCSSVSPVARSIIDLASWLGFLGRLGGFVICISLPRLRVLSNPLECVMLGNETFHYFRFAIGP
jgi:hypothetical protein